MRERALPVTTKRSQAGEGVAPLLVMTSTWSPWLSRVRSGTRRPFDLGADAGVADLGVDRIGEVDRRRAVRQRDQVAARREAEHLVLEHLELGVLEELLRAGGMLEDLEEPAHPAVLPAVGEPALLLVGPVRGDPELGHLMHVAGADLDLDLAAARARRSWCAASGSRSAWAC